VDRDLLAGVAERVNALVADPGAPLAGWREVCGLVHPGSRRSGGGDPLVTAAACLSVIDEALGHPTQRLLAYGTLRPGEANGHLLAGLGSWRRARVRGTVGDWCGYPILRPDERGPATVEAMVLTAAGLPARLADLDRFEGPAYRRVWLVADLVPDDPGTEPVAVIAQGYVDARPGGATPEAGTGVRRPRGRSG
jgi:gamma-glutamylcyclotransferase (GGCT)/AIG2-like uncharacterized protein YtfP